MHYLLVKQITGCSFASVEAANAVALDAAEISRRVFQETEDLQPTSETWAKAQAFASMNNGYLIQYGVNSVVRGISVDTGEDTVLVQVSANSDRLFPTKFIEWICDWHFDGYLDRPAEFLGKGSCDCSISWEEP